MYSSVSTGKNLHLSTTNWNLAFVLFTYMKDVQCEFKGSINVFGDNYAPNNISLELQCSPLFCLYLLFILTLLAKYFPRFFHWKYLSTSTISSFCHFTTASFDCLASVHVHVFCHLCYKHALNNDTSSCLTWDSRGNSKEHLFILQQGWKKSSDNIQENET